MERPGVGILLWPRAFSPEECASISRALPWPLNDGPHQAIHHSHVLAQFLGSRFIERMPDAPELRWLNDVTLTRIDAPRARGWHLDQPRGARWKLCMYLDNVIDGGTDFREITPACPQGTIVLFDVALEHRSAADGFAGWKRVVGLRAA